MTSNNIEYIDVKEAFFIYKSGKNVLQFLKNKYGGIVSISEIIEVAYDLQSGSYIERLKYKQTDETLYQKEVASIISKNALSLSTILDIGSGELTTLCGVADILSGTNKIEKIYALDISWSRLTKGIEYAKNEYPQLLDLLTTFCADIKKIPLPSSSIDLVISSHALEPNRAQQDSLVEELFRVAKKRLMLFEPCYEIGSEEAKRRMDEHGYIRGLDITIKRLGGLLMDTVKISNVDSLNPTVCYIIDLEKNTTVNDANFTVPGTNCPLVLKNNFYRSKDSGLSFPILDGVPILRRKYGIVSTALDT